LAVLAGAAAALPGEALRVELARCAGRQERGPWQCLVAPPRHLPEIQSLLNMHGLPSGRSPAAAGRAGMARQIAAKVSATTSVLMDTPP